MPDNRLPTNQSQLDIVNKLEEIKDAIAQGGGGGGGGTGGHTIIDENGNSMPARAGLQFVGGAGVSDDATNNKTIVNISGGGGGFGLVQSGHTVYTLTGQNLEVRVPITFDTPFPEVPNVALSLSDPSRGQYYNPQTGLGVMNVTENGFDILIKSSDNAVAGDITIYWVATTKFSGNGIFHPTIYSLEEREIGVWKDGKPLYQKTYTVPTSSAQISYNDWTNVGIDVSFADTMVKAFGIALDGTFQGDFLAWNDNGTLKLQSGRNGNNAYANTLTIQYTKLSDTAGSGSWTPQGVPAVHYSTDEQVIGTYLGETLYQRSYDFSANPIDLSANSWTNTTASNSGIDKIINNEAMTSDGININWLGANAGTGSYIQLLNIRNSTIGIAYLTLQYTKSS